jgi:hypothetical protein
MFKLNMIFACLRYFFGQTSSFQIKKILVFNETDDFPAYEHASTRMSLDDIRRDIRIPSYRIEIRYEIRGTKYRCVVRECDTVCFPIRKQLGLQTPRIRRALYGPKDVTARIHKYAGPNRDFNRSAGAEFFVRDMFPFDDMNHRELLLELDDGTTRTLLVDSVARL